MSLPAAEPPTFPMTFQGALDLGLHAIVEGIASCVKIGTITKEQGVDVTCMICDVIVTAADRHIPPRGNNHGRR